jgi:hypothetical protein
MKIAPIFQKLQLALLWQGCAKKNLLTAIWIGS